MLLIDNTTGSGRTWLQPSLADELFGDGQALLAPAAPVVLKAVLP